MHVLFVHQNSPAQFRSVAPRLASDYGWTCSFVTANGKAPALDGVERVLYRPHGGATRSSQVITRPFENAAGHARGVYEALKARPDLLAQRRDRVRDHLLNGRLDTFALRGFSQPSRSISP